MEETGLKQWPHTVQAEQSIVRVSQWHCLPRTANALGDDGIERLGVGVTLGLSLTLAHLLESLPPSAPHAFLSGHWPFRGRTGSLGERPSTAAFLWMSSTLGSCGVQPWQDGTRGECWRCLSFSLKAAREPGVGSTWKQAGGGPPWAGRRGPPALLPASSLCPASLGCPCGPRPSLSRSTPLVHRGPQVPSTSRPALPFPLASLSLPLSWADHR